MRWGLQRLDSDKQKSLLCWWVSLNDSLLFVQRAPRLSEEAFLTPGLLHTQVACPPALNHIWPHGNRPASSIYHILLPRLYPPTALGLPPPASTSPRTRLLCTATHDLHGQLSRRRACRSCSTCCRRCCHIGRGRWGRCRRCTPCRSCSSTAATSARIAQRQHGMTEESQR